jgi:hypothetical protein
MKTKVKPSTMARGIRRAYPSFFYAPAFCAVVSVCFYATHYYMYAGAFLFSACVLLPPSWMLFNTMRKTCEKTIEEYERSMIASADAETLVRGSDHPPIDHHAELLRAAGTGLETPAEELLRAGEASRQEVP